MEPQVEHHVKKPLTNQNRLGQILLDSGCLDVKTLNEALEEQLRTRMRLGEILVQRKAVNELNLARGLAKRWGLSFVDLSKAKIEPKTLLTMTEGAARRHRMIPLRLEENRSLIVAMADPLDFEAIRDLSFSTGLRVVPMMATSRDIMEALKRNTPFILSSSGDLERASSQLVQDFLVPNQTNDFQNLVHVRSLDDRSSTAPVVRLTDLIVGRAIQTRVSDIHIEPERDSLRVRYRIDGLLREKVRLTKRIHAAIVSRIKVLARLDIAERRIPQDGSIRYRVDQREIDLRVSTLPTQYGEKVVIRILDQERILVSLEGLGFSPPDLNQVRSLLARKQGILLVTGPTGSGKTTTLYSMIKELQSEGSNIVTVEDPIEYHLDGINQVQVNPGIGLTFANTLRAFLRQDPNIILVGEIRDLETAEIAIRAATTGHLVLSTLHTNDASGAITRLLDLGVPRFLVAASIIGCIAQRLVRRLCTGCRVPIQPSEDFLQAIHAENRFFNESIFSQGKSCSICDSIGYHGRVGLFEILEITPSIGEKISRGASALEIRSAVFQGPTKELWQDGIQKLCSGVTSPEELLRVIDFNRDPKSG